MYENKHTPLSSRHTFVKRVFRNFILANIILAFSLFLGMAGYHWLGHLGWVDSLLNASMILTGMGPVNAMESDAAKIFASAYAIFSGVAFLTTVGVLLAPAIHRLMHKFHLQDDDK